MRAPDPDSQVWINGRRVAADQARVSVTDPAFLAGIGVFETLALRDGALLDLREHLVRLSGGAAALGVPLPEEDAIREALWSAVAEHPAESGWLKIVATRGGDWVVFSGALDPSGDSAGLSAVLLPWKRSLADPLTGVKSLNYAANMLGLERARARGADEGIWLNTRGHLAEGCTSNVFIVDGRKLFTPHTRDGILPGIVRGLVLRAARERGLAVHEGKVRLKRLEQATEAFVTSSLRGVRPLVTFDGRPLGRGDGGAITRLLAGDTDRLRQVDRAGTTLPRRHG